MGVGDAELDSAVRDLQALARMAPEVPGRVEFGVRDGLAQVVLDGPLARNALTVGMMAQLAQAVVAVRGADVGVVLLRSSTSGAFCAGGHLGQVRACLVAPDAAEVMCRSMTVVLDALLSSPAVSVALVDGPAIGGGAELAVSADLRVFTAAGSMQWRQAALGVAAGWGGASRLVELVGARRALSLMATGRAVDGHVGEHLGVVDAAVDDVDAAMAWVDALVSTPPAALRACKRQVLARDRDEERRAFLAVWGGPAHRRALGLTSAP